MNQDFLNSIILRLKSTLTDGIIIRYFLVQSSNNNLLHPIPQ